MTPQPSPNGSSTASAVAPSLRGLITDVDLPQAEVEWPGLRAFLGELPVQERPPTFLDLVWRFETWRATSVLPS